MKAADKRQRSVELKKLNACKTDITKENTQVNHTWTERSLMSGSEQWLTDVKRELNERNIT